MEYLFYKFCVLYYFITFIFNIFVTSESMYVDMMIEKKQKVWKTKFKYRNSCFEVFCKEDVLKICSKFTGENPYRSVILIKLLRNFIEIIPQHGCSPVTLQHIIRTSFPKNTSGSLLLKLIRNAL